MDRLQAIFRRIGTPLTRYILRIGIVVVVIAGVGWFFFLRAPDHKADTSKTDTTLQTSLPQTAAADESKNTAAKSTTTQTSSTSTDTGKELVSTGPGDVVAVFAAAVLGGTLLWEWRLRRAQR